jgi:hypothetical protein
MTKTLSFAALFLAGTFAAMASLTSLPSEPALDSAASRTADQHQRVTQRGTRGSFVTRTDAEPAVGAQPRRGERAEL